MSTRLTSDAERLLARSLKALGLKPGASERDADTAYFTESAAIASDRK